MAKLIVMKDGKPQVFLVDSLTGFDQNGARLWAREVFGTLVASRNGSWEFTPKGRPPPRYGFSRNFPAREVFFVLIGIWAYFLLRFIATNL